jgi:transcriptional regulator with XRE-family HTH domain
MEVCERPTVLQQQAFGSRLRELILSRFPSLNAFSDAIEMERPYLSRIVNGHIARPSDETLRRVAGGLGLSLAELRVRTGLDEPTGDAPPRDVVIVRDARGDEVAVPLDEAIAYVEANAIPASRRRLEALKEELRDDPDAYRRIVGKIFQAWQSNFDGILGAAETLRNL